MKAGGACAKEAATEQTNSDQQVGEHPFGPADELVVNWGGTIDLDSNKTSLGLIRTSNVVGLGMRVVKGIVFEDQTEG